MSKGSTPEEENLIRAVVAEPDADEPRLAYARWLRGQGQEPRARLIEVQCQLHRLREEERDLLARHGHDWGRRLQDLGADRWAFHRGFPEEIGMSAFHLLATHESIQTVTPIRRLNLGLTHDDQLEALARLPSLRRLESLEIGSPGIEPAPVEVGVRGLRALAASEHLNGLKRLTVHSHVIGEAGVGVIARSPALARLTHLTLADPALGRSHRGGETADAVVTAPSMAGLQELILGRDVVRGHELRRWRSSNLPSELGR